MKPRPGLSVSSQDTLWKNRSFSTSGRHRYLLFFPCFICCCLRGSRRLLRGSDVRRLPAARHRRPRRVYAPLALYIILRFLEQFGRQLRIAARQHGVTRLAVAVLLEPDRWCLGVKLEGIFPLLAQRRVVAHQIG